MMSGPIEDLNFQPHLLESFKEFVLNKLKIETKYLYDVLILENELFANSDEIFQVLKEKFSPLKVKMINPTKVPLTRLIKDVSSAKNLIGIHSSYNVFSLFLRQGVYALFLFY